MDWTHAVLDAAALFRVILCMSMLSVYEKDQKQMPLEHYITGLTWLSKSDIHMQFEPHAFGCFYAAFRAAVTDWRDATDDEREPRERVAGEMARVVPAFDERDKFLSAGEAFVLEHKLTPMSLTDAVGMKIICDALFIDLFQKRAKTV